MESAHFAGSRENKPSGLVRRVAKRHRKLKCVSFKDKTRKSTVHDTVLSQVTTFFLDKSRRSRIRSSVTPLIDRFPSATRVREAANLM